MTIELLELGTAATVFGGALDDDGGGRRRGADLGAAFGPEDEEELISPGISLNS